MTRQSGAINAVARVTRRQLLLAIGSSGALSSCGSSGYYHNYENNINTKREYILFNGPIMPETFNVLYLTIAESIKDGANDIYLAMTTHGGDVESGIKIFNLLAEYQNSRVVTITIHNTDYVQSMGCYIFLAAQRRVASPNATFLFHAARQDVKDEALTTADLQERLQIAASIDQILLQMLSDRTRISKGESESFIKYQTVLSAMDAERAGIVSEIANFEMPEGTAYRWLRGIPDAEYPLPTPTRVPAPPDGISVISPRTAK